MNILSHQSPDEVRDLMQYKGYWYTYWRLRHRHGLRRRTTLYLMWVGFWTLSDE